MMLTLPWPPTVNHYWIMVRNRPILSERAREYRAEVAEIVEREDAKQSDLFQKKLVVIVLQYPPDKRRRDIDNPCKALLDALTHAEVWEDDSQIDLMTISRMKPVKDGRVEIWISEVKSDF